MVWLQACAYVFGRLRTSKNIRLRHSLLGLRPNTLAIIVFRHFNVFSLMKQKSRHSHAHQKNSAQLKPFDLYRPNLKQDLMDAYQNHDQNGMIDALYNYMIAATVFYGVVSYQDFQTLIKHYTNIEIDNPLFLDTLNYTKSAYQTVNINGELFAVYSFLENTLEPNDYIPYIKSVIDARKDILMHILPESEFIQYMNPFFTKMTPAMNETSKYIKSHRLCAKHLYKDVDEMLFFFKLSAQLMHYNPISLMQFIITDRNQNARFTDFQAMQDNLEVFIDAYNDLPLWYSYGWSPNELPVSNLTLTLDSYMKKVSKSDFLSSPNKGKQLPNSNGLRFVTENDESEDDNIVESPQPQTPQYPKVGRNDPCPCGSGKKYKHCHGKS